MGLLVLVLAFDLSEEFAQCLPQLLFCQLGAVDDEGDNSLFHFFLHGHHLLSVDFLGMEIN